MSTTSVTTRLSAINTLVVLFGLSGLLMSGTLGCRSSRDNQIDLLERELRTQEDYIYELEDYVLEYSEKLRKIRCAEPHTIVTQSKPSEPEFEPKSLSDEQSAAEPFKQLPEPEEPEPESDESQPQPIEELDLEELDIPELEFENPEPIGQYEEFEQDLQEEAKVVRDLDNDDTIFFHDDAAELAFGADEPSDDEYVSEAEFLLEEDEPESSEASYRLAERLVITEVFRGDDGEEPPTSLLAVIEARDENDEPVDLDGKVSLMVMTADPASPQRLKRWDFSNEETASAWQSSQLGDGLHLELPLDVSAMSEEPLELWVRLVGTDGRKLLAQLPLQWEHIISVEAAMDAQQLAADEDLQLVENSARPLQRQEPEVLSFAEQKPTRSSKANPQWRASMQRTHTLAGGYSTTASAAKGWTSQPTGGREPFSPATAVRQPGQEPIRTASRAFHDSVASPSNSTGQEPRPRWSPPSSAR